MGFGIALLAIGTAGLGAASSAQNIRAQQRFARRQAAAQNRNITAQTRQIQRQAAVEQQQSFDRAQQIRSRIRVAAGESGIAGGGTAAAFMRQADFDAAFNEQIIAENVALNIAAVQSSRTPSAPIQNQALAAILGGLSGLQTGLSLGLSGQRIATNLRGSPPATTPGVG